MSDVNTLVMFMRMFFTNCSLANRIGLTYRKDTVLKYHNCHVMSVPQAPTGRHRT